MAKRLPPRYGAADISEGDMLLLAVLTVFLTVCFRINFFFHAIKKIRRAQAQPWRLRRHHSSFSRRIMAERLVPARASANMDYGDVVALVVPATLFSVLFLLELFQSSGSKHH